MYAEIVHFAYNNCHTLGGPVLHRAAKFAVDNDLDSNPEILWHTLASQMAAQNPDTVVIAAVDGKKVAGHLVARAVNYDGNVSVMITQLQIDSKMREDREETMAMGWAKLEEWAKSINAKNIRCWAMNEKVANLFERFGLVDKGYVLMEIGVSNSEDEDGVPEEN